MRIFARILDSLKRRPEIDWDDLETTLIQADLGLPLAIAVVEEARNSKLRDAEEVAAFCREHLAAHLPTDPPLLRPATPAPHVILVVGVNGTGKTTSTAKLANWLKLRGRSVTLAAADTFRAAAIEQLEIWAGRINVPLVKGAYKADPSAVCHDAFQAARANRSDYLICDTAGRLHNRHNLMAELEKVRRTLAKLNPDAPHDAYLVIDATTGSNALNQAREFQKTVPLTGVIATKLDGSGKGGVVIAIQNELDLPTRFIGTGEQITNFAPFNRERFTAEIL